MPPKGNTRYYYSVLSIQEHTDKFVFITSNLAMFTWNTVKIFLDAT